MTAVLEAKRAPEAFQHRVIPGMTRALLAEHFASLGFTKGAEIGVADGRFSLVLCQTIPGLRLLCVDPYRKYDGNPRGGPQSQHDGNYAKAQERPQNYDVLFLRRMSVEAAQTVPDGSLDFVFIDGNHQKEFVTADLEAWAPKVRSGGIVSGHDLYDFPRRPAGVVEAIAEYTTKHGIDNWFICDEREPSFWWVK